MTSTLYLRDSSIYHHHVVCAIHTTHAYTMYARYLFDTIIPLLLRTITKLKSISETTHRQKEVKQKCGDAQPLHWNHPFPFTCTSRRYNPSPSFNWFILSSFWCWPTLNIFESRKLLNTTLLIAIDSPRDFPSTCRYYYKLMINYEHIFWHLRPCVVGCHFSSTAFKLYRLLKGTKKKLISNNRSWLLYGSGNFGIWVLLDIAG